LLPSNLYQFLLNLTSSANSFGELLRHRRDKELPYPGACSGTSLPTANADARALGGFSHPQLAEALRSSGCECLSALAGDASVKYLWIKQRAGAGRRERRWGRGDGRRGRSTPIPAFEQNKTEPGMGNSGGDLKDFYSP